MRKDKITRNNQYEIRFLHDNAYPQGFVYLHQGVETASKTNPHARELVVTKIQGQYVSESENENRYVVAYRHREDDELGYMPETYRSRAKAEEVATVVAQIFDHVMVLDVNYKIPQYSPRRRPRL